MMESMRVKRDPIPEEEIKEMAAELNLLFDELQIFKESHKIENETLSIYSWHDGTCTVGGDALDGWCIIHKPDGTRKLRYSYEKELEGQVN